MAMHATRGCPQFFVLPLLPNAENWQKISFESAAKMFCRSVAPGGDARLTPLMGQGGEGPAVAAGQEVSMRTVRRPGCCLC